MRKVLLLEIKKPKTQKFDLQKKNEKLKKLWTFWSKKIFLNAS